MNPVYSELSTERCYSRKFDGLRITSLGYGSSLYECRLLSMFVRKSFDNEVSQDRIQNNSSIASVEANLDLVLSKFETVLLCK